MSETEERLKEMQLELVCAHLRTRIPFVGAEHHFQNRSNGHYEDCREAECGQKEGHNYIHKFVQPGGIKFLEKTITELYRLIESTKL